MTPSTVFIVGAGPGHPDLLTRRGAALLQDADVVVYDRLVLEDVLALAPASAERVFGGKTVGDLGARQQQINELLATRAREGKKVVRLKGGDPFLFGRGAEEAEYLAAQGVPFEVVPGVSSALAAPLAAGIAVTHRLAASAVVIATGHESNGHQPRLDWEALARIDTVVFLMAVENLRHITARLVEQGRDVETPAAVIQMAYCPGQHVVTGTLGTIAYLAELEAIEAPATLVIGEVVRLRCQPPKTGDVQRQTTGKKTKS